MCGCRPVTILVLILLGVTGITAPITITTSVQLGQAASQVERLGEAANKLEDLNRLLPEFEEIARSLKPLAHILHCLEHPLDPSCVWPKVAKAARDSVRWRRPGP